MESLSDLLRNTHLRHTLRTGDKYALIGQEFGEADRKDTSSLPACVDALFFLAQIGRDLVRDLILEEKVHENSSAKKAQTLRNQYRPDLEPKQRPFNASRWLAKIQKHLDTLEKEGTIEDRATVLPGAREAIDRLSSKINPQ